MLKRLWCFLWGCKWREWIKIPERQNQARFPGQDVLTEVWNDRCPRCGRAPPSGDSDR